MSKFYFAKNQKSENETLIEINKLLNESRKVYFVEFAVRGKLRTLKFSEFTILCEAMKDLITVSSEENKIKIYMKERWKNDR